jgi:RNA polymerase sigma-70 factor (ECF subfamily)
VALAQAGDPEAGLAALDAIPAERIVNYQPFWAARGHLLHLLKRNEEARLAWERATGLTDDPALRRYLVERSVLRRRKNFEFRISNLE